jgi:hypothetical protein
MIANENRSDSVAHLPGRHREQPVEGVPENTWFNVPEPNLNDYCLHPTEACYHLEEVTDQR